VTVVCGRWFFSSGFVFVDFCVRMDTFEPFIRRRGDRSLRVGCVVVGGWIVWWGGSFCRGSSGVGGVFVYFSIFLLFH